MACCMASRTHAEAPRLRRYREMLFTAPNIQEYVAGVICFDETIRSVASDGEPLINKVPRPAALVPLHLLLLLLLLPLPLPLPLPSLLLLLLLLPPPPRLRNLRSRRRCGGAGAGQRDPDRHQGGQGDGAHPRDQRRVLDAGTRLPR